MRILIADDNPVYLKLLQSFTGRLGFQPECYPDGDQAWAALMAEDAPRLAVLDWEMPGRTGIDIVTGLRASPRAGRTYCILLTAHTEAEDIAGALTAGAHDYVRKPMHHEEMRVRLSLWRRLAELEGAVELCRQPMAAQGLIMPTISALAYVQGAGGAASQSMPIR